MNIVQALILGIIQGITEFLPVSSSTHLAFAKQIMGIESGEWLIHFDLMCHFGTLFAVLITLRRDVWKILHSFRLMFLFTVALLPLIPAYFLFKPLRILLSHDAGFFLLGTALWMYIASSRFFAPVPALACGGDRFAQIPVIRDRKEINATLIEEKNRLDFEDFSAAGIFFDTSKKKSSIDKWIFPSISVAFISLRSLKATKWQNVLWIGVAQSLALLPGISRSGSTIATARMLGWEWKEAARFSFLLSIPTILGGSAMETIHTCRTLSSIPWGLCAAGFGASFITGMGSVRLLFRMLDRKTLRPFAWYCMVVAMIALLGFR